MSLNFATPKLADEQGRLAALYRYEILDTDPEQEFEDIIRLVKSIFGVPKAAVSLVAEDRQWFKASAGLDMSQTPRSVAFCDYTIRSTDALAVKDATQDPRFSKFPLVTGPTGIRCYLGVPLTTPEGYNVGALCIMGADAREFSEADSIVLANFAQLVVSKMELRMLARRDALTGALTRRAFEEAMRAATEAEPTGAEAPWLLLFDVDHFKMVNDRWGHPAGDQVLRSVSAALAGGVGRGDRLGRLGGEEFGVLLLRADQEAASDVAESLRAEIAALDLPGLEGHSVTVSCGVAAWKPSQDDIAVWTAAADVALYAAKRNGRNRVMLAA